MAVLALVGIPDPTDQQFVGAVLLADAMHDLSLIRSAYQKK